MKLLITGATGLVGKELVKKAVTYPKLGKWGLLSQNLVLDIYNAQDNFDGIIEQVAFWKTNTLILARQNLDDGLATT